MARGAAWKGRLSLGGAWGTARTPCCVVGMATVGLGDMQALEQRAAQTGTGSCYYCLESVHLRWTLRCWGGGSAPRLSQTQDWRSHSLQRRMACQEAPALRRNDEGDQPPRATVLAVLEVVSDIAAVFRLLQGEGLGPDPGPSAVLGCWDTASGQWTLRSLAPELWPVLLWLHLWWWAAGGGSVGLECLPHWTSRAHLTGRQRSCECSPEDKPGDGSCARVHSATHTLIEACGLRVRLSWLKWAAWVPDATLPGTSGPVRAGGGMWVGPCLSAHPSLLATVGLGKALGWCPDPGPLLGLFPKNCPGAPGPPPPPRTQPFPPSFSPFPDVFPSSFLPAVLV